MLSCKDTGGDIMTLQQLRHFEALSRTGSMRRAAELTYISEPALSMSIAKLEEEFNLPLLERSGRNVRLNRAGWELAEHASRILREAEEAERHMISLAESRGRRVRIGYVTPLAQRYVPEKLRAFLDTPGNEKTEFESESGTTPELVRGLKNGIYDMILCSDPGDDPALSLHQILKQRLLLISPKDKPEEIHSLNDLEDLSLIGYPRNGAMDTFLSELQGREKFQLQFTSRAPDEMAIAALVMQRLGAAVIAEVDGLEAYDLHRQALPGHIAREIFLVRLKDLRLIGIPGKFFRFLEEQASR